MAKPAEPYAGLALRQALRGGVLLLSSGDPGPRRHAGRDREPRHPSVDRHRGRAYGAPKLRDPAGPPDGGHRHRDGHRDRRHPAWTTTSKSPAAAAIRSSIRRALRSDDQQPAPITDLQGARGSLQLHEKGGKRHDLPAHDRAEATVNAYLAAGGIEDAKVPLFQQVDRSGCLSARR